jgi:hypothetical protein
MSVAVIEEKKIEFSENLIYDNKNVFSGYPLKAQGLRPVQGSITELTDDLQEITFETGPINWYANKTNLNLGLRLDAADVDGAQGITSFLNCLMKIPPIDRVRVNSKSSKNAIEVAHVFRMACSKYFGSESKLSSKPGSPQSFSTMCDFTTVNDAGGKIFYYSWNLAEMLKAFFNTRNEIPLTEVLQITFTFVKKSTICYTFAKYLARSANDNGSIGGGILYRDAVVNEGYAKSLKPWGNVANAANNGFVNTLTYGVGYDRPVNAANATTAGVEIVGAYAGAIVVTECSLSYEQERNPLVDLTLKNLVRSEGGLLIPFINCVASSQTFANLSNSYSMSIRLTNNVGNKLKRIMFTTGLANDVESLTKLGTYNSSVLGTARIKKVEFDIGGRNISAQGVSNYDYLGNKEYNYVFDNQVDSLLERDNGVPNTVNLIDGATFTTPAQLGINPSRFRALPRNTFMLDLPFESVEKDEMYSMNSGIPLNGDEVLNITVTLEKAIDPGLSGIRITCFLFGIKHMLITPQLIDFV